MNRTSKLDELYSAYFPEPHPLGRIVRYFILVSTLLLIGIGILVGPEGYYFPYPSIDTRYAPGYSERNFRKVVRGMTKEEVLELLGPPLGNCMLQPQFMINVRSPSMANKYALWEYTCDNAFPLADFAWLSRRVEFGRYGRVTNTSSRIYYD